MDWILLLTFVALNVADVVSTLLILKAGGKELNAAIRFFMDRLGRIPGLVAPKIVAVGAVLAIVYFIPGEPVISVLLAVLCLVFGFVVFNNFRVLKNLKRR